LTTEAFPLRVLHRYVLIVGIVSALTACNAETASLPRAYDVASQSTTGKEFLYAGDGPDRIQEYAIDSKSGALHKIGTAPCGRNGTSGSGGYIAVDAVANYLYCSSANGQRIVGYAINANSGPLTKISGSPFTDPYGRPTQLAVTPDGAYLCVEHRTVHGSSPSNIIATFPINAVTGALSVVSGSAFNNGDWGSHGMAVTPSGKFLYITE
jgi:6-phosphogluconolactonase (cycloisomerase 2 family)